MPEAHSTHIQVGCPSCSRVLRIRPQYLHRNLCCNHCNHQFTPQASDVLPSEPPPLSDDPTLDSVKLLLCCPGCLRDVRVRKRWLGRAVICKHCDESFVAYEPEGYAWPDVESEEGVSAGEESVSIQALQQPAATPDIPNPVFDDLLSALNDSSPFSTDAEPTTPPRHADSQQKPGDAAPVHPPDSSASPSVANELAPFSSDESEAHRPAPIAAAVPAPQLLEIQARLAETEQALPELRCVRESLSTLDQELRAALDQHRQAWEAERQQAEETSRHREAALRQEITTARDQAAAVRAELDQLLRDINQRMTLQADELARSRQLLEAPRELESSALELATAAANRLDSLDAALQDFKNQWLQTSQVATPPADDPTATRLLSLESLTNQLGDQLRQLADSIPPPQIPAPVPDARLEAAHQALEKDVKRLADSLKNLLLRQEDIERQTTTSHGLLADTQNAALAALPALESRLLDAQRHHQRQLERLRTDLATLESHIARLDKIDSQAIDQHKASWETAQYRLDDLLARFESLEASHAQAEARSQADQQAATARVDSLETQLAQIRDDLAQSSLQLEKDLSLACEAQSQYRQTTNADLAASLSRHSNDLSQTRDSFNQLRVDLETHRQVAPTRDDLARALEPLHAEVARALTLATEAQHKAATTPTNPIPELTAQVDHLRGLLEQLERAFDYHKESLTLQETALTTRVENLEQASAAQPKSLRDDLLASVEARLAAIESSRSSAPGTANGGPYPSSPANEPKAARSPSPAATTPRPSLDPAPKRVPEVTQPLPLDYALDLLYDVEELATRTRKPSLGSTSTEPGPLAAGTARVPQYNGLDRQFSTLLKNHDWDQAIVLAHQLARLSFEQVGPNHTDHALWLRNLGSLHLRTGKVEEGEKYLLQALDICRVTEGAEGFATAICLIDLAELRAAEGRITIARDLCRQALEVFSKNVGDQHPLVQRVQACLQQLNESDQPFPSLGTLSIDT